MTTSDNAARIDRERAFHDERFTHDEARAGASKFYDTVGASRDDYNRAVREVPPGARTLELGCGEYTSAFDLAAAGAHPLAIDISPVAVKQSERDAQERGISEARFVVMNAEELDLPDEEFDNVHASGVLHHLDVNQAMKGINRVLKPGGRAVFVEPLGHNPLINAYRNRTPGMRSEDEHPLLRADLRMIRRHFPNASYRYYHLFTLAAVPFRNKPYFRRLLSALEALDRVALRVPGLRSMAWMVVIDARK